MTVRVKVVTLLMPSLDSETPFDDLRGKRRDCWGRGARGGDDCKSGHSGASAGKEMGEQLSDR